MGRRVVLVLISSLFVVAGCTSTTAKPTIEGPLPAGRTPSEIALMVCQSKAAGEIQEVLGETAVVEDRTWVDHLYSCDYRFKSGSIVLSVKELSSWSQTLAYYGGLAKSLGKKATLSGLGQGGFQAPDGAVVVRKDWKVLLVNVSGLPSYFGSPPTSSADVAATVAYIILGCWAGD